MSATRSGRVYNITEGLPTKRTERTELQVESMTDATASGDATSAALSGNKDEVTRLLMEDKRRQEEQMERLMRLLESSCADSMSSAAISHSTQVARKPKLRSCKADDIESYLTTFERLMEAYDIAKGRWTYKLAPQLTGRAQQAYAALPADEAKDYDQVKAALLH